MSAIREHRIQSGDVNLAAYSRGDTSKPTVVLVHGYPDSSRVWDFVAERLGDRFHVVTYDVRGAGYSDAPKRVADYKLDKLSGDLKAVTDALCPDRPFHLVAHDWGSIQSWESVTAEHMQSRIASYTSISGPCLDHVGHWMRHRVLRPTPGNLAQLLNQLLHSWYIYMFHIPWLAPWAWKNLVAPRWTRLLKRIEGVDAEPVATRVKDGEHCIKLYRANIFQRTLLPRERYASMPVQMLVPLQDKYVMPDLTIGLSRWVPKLWQRELAAGHFGALDASSPVGDQVAEFVGFVESGNETIALRRARVTPKKKAHSGKVVVVTGAGSGIGRETLLEFAEHGAVVVAADINGDAADRSAELARLVGAEAHVYVVDVGSTEQMEKFADWVQREVGVPDIVVNNAGIGLAGKLMDTGTADWDKLLRVNLWSVIHGSRLFAQQMIAARKPGHIVNTASAAAFAPNRNLPAYATTKAAVLMLTDCLRAELHEHSIKAIAVCPGLIDTGITTATRFIGVSEDEQARQRARAKRLYQRRNLKPDAVAKKIRRAVEKNHPLVLVGSEAYFLNLIARFFPGLSRLMARVNLAP